MYGYCCKQKQRKGSLVGQISILTCWWIELSFITLCSSSYNIHDTVYNNLYGTHSWPDWCINKEAVNIELDANNSTVTDSEPQSNVDEEEVTLVTKPGWLWSICYGQKTVSDAILLFLFSNWFSWFLKHLNWWLHYANLSTEQC
jgi:hypothetical protein